MTNSDPWLENKFSVLRNLGLFAAIGLTLFVIALVISRSTISETLLITGLALMRFDFFAIKFRKIQEEFPILALGRA